MDSNWARREGSVRYVLHFLMLLVGLILATALLPVAVPSKILLIGAALICLAVWGKRKHRQERKS